MIGNWVVFRTTIEGVKLIAIAYAWSNKDVAYVLSTVGTTSTCKEPYVSFSPEFGFDGGDTKMHPRAEIVDFLFRNLPTIDNFNKLRLLAAGGGSVAHQELLGQALERSSRPVNRQSTEAIVAQVS